MHPDRERRKAPVRSVRRRLVRVHHGAGSSPKTWIAHPQTPQPQSPNPRSAAHPRGKRSCGGHAKFTPCTSRGVETDQSQLARKRSFRRKRLRVDGRRQWSPRRWSGISPSRNTAGIALPADVNPLQLRRAIFPVEHQQSGDRRARDVLLDPSRATAPRITALHIAFDYFHGLCPGDMPVSWLNRTPHALAVYASTVGRSPCQPNFDPGQCADANSIL